MDTFLFSKFTKILSHIITTTRRRNSCCRPHLELISGAFTSSYHTYRLADRISGPLSRARERDRARQKIQEKLHPVSKDDDSFVLLPRQSVSFSCCILSARTSTELIVMAYKTFPDEEEETNYAPFSDGKTMCTHGNGTNLIRVVDAELSEEPHMYDMAPGVMFKCPLLI